MTKVPSLQQLAKSRELPGLDAFEYLVQAFQKLITKANLWKNDAVVAKYNSLQDELELARLQYKTTGKSWGGVAVSPPGIHTLNENLFDKILRELKEGILAEDNGLKMDASIPKDDQFVRAFSQEGEPIENKEVLAQLDNLLNAWLAQKDIINIDSTMYEAENGKIKKNESKENVRADPQKVERSIKELTEYLKKEKVDFEAVLHDPEVVAKAKQVTEHTADVTPDSDEPSSTMRKG